MNGYVTGKIIVEILKRCGDDLTRENLMKQATSVKDLLPFHRDYDSLMG
jgi:branched-chain amino acid transport system substrate-binding protein